MPLIGAYGRALADVNQYKQALETLDRAHSPDNPDWRMCAVQRLKRLFVLVDVGERAAIGADQRI